MYSDNQIAAVAPFANVRFAPEISLDGKPLTIPGAAVCACYAPMSSRIRALSQRPHMKMSGPGRSPVGQGQPRRPASTRAQGAWREDRQRPGGLWQDPEDRGAARLTTGGQEKGLRPSAALAG